MNFFRKRETHPIIDTALASMEVEAALERELPQVAKPKPTIERAFDTTLDLLEKMQSRRNALTAKIAELNEELRQTIVVIEGASLMMGTIEVGLGKVNELNDEVRKELEKPKELDA